MFFPYRAQIALYRLPLITIFVSLLCIGIYTGQFLSQRALVKSTITFCERQYDRAFHQMLGRVTGTANLKNCVELMLRIHHAKGEKAELLRVTSNIREVAGVKNADTQGYYGDILHTAYQSYRRSAPTNLTERLWYPPESWNVMRMLSAAVAHGSWGHLIGNLLFFFAFAATIEILIGPLLYVGVLIALALGTHVVYSLATAHLPQALPTVGLSGVVMGIIALFTYFIPKAKIRCFLWLVIFFRRFGLPAWLLATWYIGWDVYAQLAGGGNSGVNLVAHLSGAAIGLTIGMVFFRAKRHWAQELVET